MKLSLVNLKQFGDMFASVWRAGASAMVRFNLFAIAVGVAFAGGAAAARVERIVPFYGMTDSEIGLGSLALALLIIAIGVSLTQVRLNRKMREITEASTRFEEAASRSMAEMSNRIDRLAQAQREAVVPPPAVAPTFGATPTPRAFRPVAAEPRPKVVPLDPLRAKGDNATLPSVDELGKAVAEGRFAALFQPVIALPSRRTRILDCQPHLLAGGREIEPEAWRGLAGDVASVARIDQTVLVDCIRLLRELKRSDKPGRVLCRLSREAIGHSERWIEICDVLRSNQAYLPYLHIETRLAELTAMSTQELDRLHELREMRCMVSLDCGQGGVKLPGSMPPGLFALVRAPAAALLEFAGGGRLAVDRLRSALSAEAELCATQVTTEEQVIALIDNDVLLAQGPLLGAARALRQQMAGE